MQHRAEEWERLLRRAQDEADARIASVSTMERHAALAECLHGSANGSQSLI